MHIAIEGMDGVGKTTTARRLANRLGFRIVEKPLHFLFDKKGRVSNYIRIRDHINKQVKNNALRAWFYGLGNIFLYHNFPGENIITDRHLVSNYFWCGSKDTESIFRCLVDLIGKPDITILLHASAQEGARRILRRNISDPDIDKTRLYRTAKVKMISFLKRYRMQYVSIDTTHLSVEDVVDKIVDSLPSRLKRSLESKAIR